MGRYGRRRRRRAIVATGATQPPGGAHAEREALRHAGAAARGATLVTTLEPCAHTGRTPPCVDAIVDAGIRRVVVGIEDPDPKVAGQGIAALRAAGHRGDRRRRGRSGRGAAGAVPHPPAHRAAVRGAQARRHRRRADRGRPTAPASGSPARRPGPTPTACGPRATPCSSAPAPSAPTTRRSPSATWPGVIRCASCSAGHRHGARVHPCLELSGDLGGVLDELGRRDVVQLLVEGGATVAHAFHAAGLVDRYVVYLAPAVMGGDDALGLFRGPAAPSIDALRRGRFVVRDTASATICGSTWTCGATLEAWTSSASPRPACRPSTASSAASPTRPTRRRRRPATRPTWRSSSATSPASDDVLVRMHSECLTGDVFGSRRCDCGPQLDESLRLVAEEGAGRHRLPVRPRGAGHRHRPQAARLRAAGRGARHGRRQPRAGPAGRHARLRHRRGDPPRPRRRAHPAADEQPGQGQRADGLRRRRGRAGPAGHDRPRGQRRLPADQARAARPPLRGRLAFVLAMDVRPSTIRHASERAPASERPATACVAGERSERAIDPQGEGIRRRHDRPAGVAVRRRRPAARQGHRRPRRLRRRSAHRRHRLRARRRAGAGRPRRRARLAARCSR